MERNVVGWFEIYVENMEAAKDFYQSVFHLELQKLENPEVELWMFPGSPEKPGATGALVRMDGIASGNNSTLVYFSCVDCLVESGRVEASGGTVLKPKWSIGEFGFIALVTDLEGNMFGLHSMR